MSRSRREAAAPVTDALTDADVLLRLVPEQLPVMVYVYDLRKQRNLYANARFTELLGYPRDVARQTTTRLIRDILHPEDRAVLERAPARFATVADREVVESEFRVRTLRGDWRWMRSRDMVFSRSPDGSPHLILGTAEDITSQKEAAEQERQHRRHIEAEQERLRRLLELVERERRLVAYDIHDGLVQDVVGAQLAIDHVLEHVAITDPEGVSSLLRIRAHIRKAIDEGRRVVSELRPATTEDTRLVEAIQFLIHEAEATHRLKVAFSFPADFPLLELMLERTLARIAQEALNNVKRHAHTRQATVRLQFKAGFVRLEVEDQGVGFDRAAVPPGRYGLEGMRERARLFGGKATIRSRPGKGTNITVVVPAGTVSSPARPPLSRRQPARRKPRS